MSGSAFGLLGVMQAPTTANTSAALNIQNGQSAPDIIQSHVCAGLQK